jgi:hypothetical protein
VSKCWWSDLWLPCDDKTQDHTIWACFRAHLSSITSVISALRAESEDLILAGTHATPTIAHPSLRDKPGSLSHSLLSCSPLILGSVVRLEARITGMEGRKVFLSCEAQSSDRNSLYTEASGKDTRIPFSCCLSPTLGTGTQNGFPHC